MVLLDKLKIIPQKLIVSALVIDSLDGERILVLNRLTGNVVAHYPIKDGNNIRILPVTFSTSSDLSVIMYDADEKYSAVIVDNVQCMPIDLMSFDPMNPQPYESPA